MRWDLSGGRRIELARGDLTREETDAIVNAANSSLMGGGGVDGAIHRAGGSEILEACKEIRLRQGPLPTGEAVVTTGGRLPARLVIHTVGPVYRGGSQGEAELLARCHRASIRLADELGLSSVAFPAISTGVYGYPLDQAAPVALEAVAEGLSECSSVELAKFVLFGEDALEAFRRAALDLFGSSD